MDANKTFNATIKKTAEFQAIVASMLVRSDSSYKGNFEFISDLQNIIAYNGDYADVFETNSRWVYENNQWVNTDKEILINPLTVEIVQVTGQSTTAVISQKGTTDAITNAKQEVEAYADAAESSAKAYADGIVDGLGTAASKDVGTASGNIPQLGEGGKLPIDTIPTGTTPNTVPIIGFGGKINRYIVPNADGGLLGAVAGQPFANRNKEGATYHEVLIDSAGMAYAFYPLIDTAMSDTSVNLVQNKVVKAYVDGIVGDIEMLLAGV